MALDSLTTENRDFYERSLVKTMLAVVYFGFALFYLGMVAFAGGQSQAAVIEKGNTDDNDVKDAASAFSAGAGFGAFFYFCSFVLALAAGFYILPATGGSAREVKALKIPDSLQQA